MFTLPLLAQKAYCERVQYVHCVSSQTSECKDTLSAELCTSVPCLNTTHSVHMLDMSYPWPFPAPLKRISLTALPS